MLLEPASDLLVCRLLSILVPFSLLVRLHLDFPLQIGHHPCQVVFLHAGVVLVHIIVSLSLKLRETGFEKGRVRWNTFERAETLFPKEDVSVFGLSCL